MAAKSQCCQLLPEKNISISYNRGNYIQVTTYTMLKECRSHKIFMLTTGFSEYVIVVLRIELHTLAIQARQHLASSLLLTVYFVIPNLQLSLPTSGLLYNTHTFLPPYLLLPFLFQPRSSVPPRIVLLPAAANPLPLHMELYCPSLRDSIVPVSIVSPP